MKFQPLNKRLLVEMIYADDKTASGLFIPEQAKEKPMRGVVVACGPDAIVQEGETILFGKFAGSSIAMDGKEYLILLEEDVFGKLV